MAAPPCELQGRSEAQRSRDTPAGGGLEDLDAAAFANAKPAELEAMIKSTGFFRNKAKSLIGVGQALRDEFGGRMPDTMDDLLKLPGVARKTANCVLGTWYGKNEGIVVDTHVGRLAVRLGLRGNVAKALLWESTRWDSRDQPRRKTHSSGICPAQWRSRARFW